MTTVVDVYDTTTGHVAVRAMPANLADRVQDGFAVTPTKAKDWTCPACGKELDSKENWDWSRQGLFCPGCGWEE